MDDIELRKQGLSQPMREFLLSYTEEKAVQDIAPDAFALFLLEWAFDLCQERRRDQRSAMSGDLFCIQPSDVFEEERVFVVNLTGWVEITVDAKHQYLHTTGYMERTLSFDIADLFYPHQIINRTFGSNDGNLSGT